MDQFKKKRLPLLIAGAGGKKSSGSSRTPVEADDTVNSRTMASILDLLGEGVVGGLIDGAKSIFVDGVALQNEDGSFNRSGVTWDFRDGSQDQSPMPGFDFVETPKAVNTQLKTTNAVTVAIDNDDADRVRVIMKFPSLRSIDKKTGDTNGTSVQFKFQLANGNGSFYDVIATGESSSDVTLTAKKTGVYYRSYEIQLPKPGRAYKVRVLRLSADSNDQYLFNDTWVDSIGEIVDTPMNYPNSVLVGLKVNSEQFGSSMPSRSYLIRGLKIRVPSNYDENTNTYNGVWDGTFKLLSSSNPAWILFDLLTNARYGLGKFVSESMIDLGQLYQIGRYCDEEVDDGFGGKEKRFAINTQITSRQDAYRLIQDIAGAFRGMVFWAGGMVNIMQDSPSDPVMLFTNANVKDGLFTYKGSARKDRPSVALITYNNKQDGYKQNVEYVEDQEAMARYGERKTEAVAFGCTSRGQAHRVGLWLLYTARMESDMITFTAGLDASFLMPGETVLIQNKYRAGKRNSGRIVSFTKNSITLDAPVSLKKSGSFIRIINQEGKIVERDINETGDNITKVTFKTALATADQPVANGVWTITEPDLVPMRARVVAIAQGETPGSFDITVVQNNASKYQAIDNGAALVPENTTVLDPTYSKPSNLVISEGTYLSSPGNLSVKLMLAWEGKSPEYWVSWRRSDEGNVSNWQSARATEEQYEIVNVAENGRYDFQLYSVSFGGKKSEIITAVYQVKGTMTPPGAPTSLTAVGDYRNVVLNWVNPDSVDLAQINVYASKTNKLDTATLIAQAATTT
ncbi:host specificity protein J, partial [Klebsiella pneumoniae]